MYLRAGIDSLPRMSLDSMSLARSAVPGFAIAILVLIAGLLLALTVGRYPVSFGDLLSVLFAREGARLVVTDVAAELPESALSGLRDADHSIWMRTYTA